MHASRAERALAAALRPARGGDGGQPKIRAMEAHHASHRSQDSSQIEEHRRLRETQATRCPPAPPPSERATALFHPPAALNTSPADQSAPASLQNIIARLTWRGCDPCARLLCTEPCLQLCVPSGLWRPLRPSRHRLISPRLPRCPTLLCLIHYQSSCQAWQMRCPDRRMKASGKCRVSELAAASCERPRRMSSRRRRKRNKHAHVLGMRDGA